MLNNEMLESLFQFFGGHFHQYFGTIDEAIDEFTEQVGKEETTETINLLTNFLNSKISKHDKVKILKEYSCVYCETEDEYIEFVEYTINRMNFNLKNS